MAAADEEVAGSIPALELFFSLLFFSVSFSPLSFSFMLALPFQCSNIFLVCNYAVYFCVWRPMRARKLNVTVRSTTWLS